MTTHNAEFSGAAQAASKEQSDCDATNCYVLLQSKLFSIILNKALALPVTDCYSYITEAITRQTNR
jgi:hypothetical protein